MKLINKEEYIACVTEYTYAINVEHGYVRFLADIEENCENDAHTKWKFNQYSRRFIYEICSSDSNVNQMLQVLRGIVSGGVYIEEDDAAPDRILNIFGYDEFNIISATIKETANLLPVLKDGNYIFVCHE